MSFDSAPLVIGGLGGSGTRVIAQLAQAMNVHIGECLNHALDNRWFAMLFRRQSWAKKAPDHEVLRALDIFTRASIYGLNSQISDLDIGLIDHCFTNWSLSQNKPEIAAEIKSELLQSEAMQKTEYRSWGWKEPNSHIFIPEIAEVFPNAKYILVVRNGLDMAFSRNQRQLRLWGSRFGLEVERPTDVTPELSLQYWLYANETARQNLDRRMPGRWLVVNFEKLWQDTGTEISRISEFIGVELTPKKIAELSEFVQEPSTAGRFRAHSLTVFRQDQIDAVKALGFAVN
ncbi:MAG: sulfotransferase [Litorimonas sp.]